MIVNKSIIKDVVAKFSSGCWTFVCRQKCLKFEKDVNQSTIGLRIKHIKLEIKLLAQTFQPL